MSSKPALKSEKAKKQKTFYIQSSLIALFLFVAVSMFSKTMDTAHTERSVATLDGSKKMAILNPKYIPVKHTRKLTSPIKIQIKGPKGLEVKPGQTYTIKAIVKSDIPVESAQGKWVIPKGITLESGALNMELTNLVPDEPQEVEIQISTDSYVNKKIHFNLSVKTGNTSFGSSAQHNLTDQEEINKSKANFKKRAEGGADGKTRKVFK